MKFLARGRGYGLFVTSTEAILSLSHAIAASVRGPASARSQAAGKVKPVRTKQDSAQQKTVSLWMSLVGANSAARVTGFDELSGKANYFLGNDPRKWHTNVPTYARVKYENVYPGVDLIYYGNQQDLESDFLVAPGADPGTIRLKFQGARSISINSDGDLVLKIRGGEIRLRKPVAYQRSGADPFPASDARKHLVAARYVLKGTQEVAFAVESYDTREPLIIDPVLAYSTYLGGSGADEASGIAVDAAGNAYVTGSTSSTDFPTANPFQSACTVCDNGLSNFDAFITKLSPAGDALIYSTYLGGSKGAWAQSIVVDAGGSAYVTGNTASPDLPTLNPFQGALRSGANAFVTKLNPAGDTLAYSTYLGGSTPGDRGNGITVDAAGDAYVTGIATSTDFPTTAGAFQRICCGASGGDAFITKFSSAGDTLVYSTYLGGTSSNTQLGPGPFTQGSGIAIDAAGNAYVTGQTSTTDFPTKNPFQGTCGGAPFYCVNAFVTKLNATADALVYSTYLGGSQPGPFVEGATSIANAIAVDVSGNAYVAGNTSSTNFPLANPFQSTCKACTLGGGIGAFVTKFNSAGSALVYSTYLGGSNGEIALGIAADSAGDAYVTGVTDSSDFPLANPFQSNCGICSSGGNETTFVTKFSSTGSTLVYSSYLGGSVEDHSSGIGVDPVGNVYVAGRTVSPDFPTVNAFQPTYHTGNWDSFVSKISAAPDFAMASSANSQTISAGQTATYPLSLAGSIGFSGTVLLYSMQRRAAGLDLFHLAQLCRREWNKCFDRDSQRSRPSSAGMVQHSLFPDPKLWIALACIPAFAYMFIGIPRRRGFGLRRRAWVGITAVLLFAVLSFGCGSGSSSSGTQGGTPAGTYTMTVTGTFGSLTHTVNLTLKVN